MLINLTNHPSAAWSPEQRQAALEQYGEVRDLPFPSIDPKAKTSAVRDLAWQYVQQCRAIFDERGTEHDETCPSSREAESFEDMCTCLEDAVHLMGEDCFCGSFLRQWDGDAIQVVASTTERRVEDLPDGTKRSSFRFVQFREI